jgi:hypothetical protein
MAGGQAGKRTPGRDSPQLNALVEDGLIERWAEHVRKNGGGSFPRFFVDWVDEEKIATALLPPRITY